MKQGSRRPRPDLLSDVRGQFERWRQSRKRGTRIPEVLWRAAASAGREHGVSKTAQALRLDYYALKKRVASGPEERSAVEPLSEIKFLEIPLGAPSGRPECILEFEDGQGARLRVELQGSALAELETVARALWSLAR
ncbi:MAG: hypothetical protein GY769_14405 [bacterium]|nr:hypothetical protein [bacterium]